MPADEPRNRGISQKKPPAAKQLKTDDKVNPKGRPGRSANLAAMLRRALDAPTTGETGKRRRLSNREAMIRGLVERSAAADLAATKLLLELLRNADPGALAADPADAAALGVDALTVLKQRLARLARAQSADLPADLTPGDAPSPASAAAADPAGGANADCDE